MAWVVGAFVLGGAVGTLAMALCAAAGQADRIAVDLTGDERRYAEHHNCHGEWAHHVADELEVDWAGRPQAVIQIPAEAFSPSTLVDVSRRRLKRDHHGMLVVPFELEEP
jgi:hypothetical protein